MNEQYFQDLYALIKGKDSSYEGRYSYDQFKTKIQDEAYAEQMHNWLSKRDESFKNKSLEAFVGEVKGVSTKTKPVTAQKKKFSLDSEERQQKEAASTGLSLGGGSSATQPTKRTASTFGDEVKEAMPQMKTFTAADLKKINFKKTDQERFLEEQQRKFKESIAVGKETKRRQGLEAVEEANQQKEKKSLNKGLKSVPEFLKSLNTIDSNLTAKTEEEAIVTLRSKFSKFGISFE
jgi:hypothetical protein